MPSYTYEWLDAEYYRYCDEHDGRGPGRVRASEDVYASLLAISDGEVIRPGFIILGAGYIIPDPTLPADTIIWE